MRALLSAPTWLFLAAAWALLSAAALGLRVPPQGEYALLALLVAAGLPHGALDAALLLDRLPHRVIPALLAYTGVTLLAILLWLAWPVESLAAFLLVTWVHFGSADRTSAGAPRGEAWCEGIARGGLPLTLTAAAHPEEVTRLFGVVAPGAGVEALTVILAALAPAALGCGAITVGVAGLRALRPAGGPSSRGTVALELPTLALTFALLSPLVAFSLYFALLHAPRSSRHALAALVRARASALAVRAALAATAPVLLAAAVTGWWMSGSGLGAADALVRVVFIGLAALTWPHVLLGAWLGLPGTGALGPSRPRPGGAAPETGHPARAPAAAPE